MLGCEAVDEHGDTAAGKKIAESEQRRGDFWTLVFADQADGLECRVHGGIKPYFAAR
jgi:hypothetical protein